MLNPYRVDGYSSSDVRSTMTFPCPHCQWPIPWGPQIAGLVVACPQCSMEVAAPSEAPVAGDAAPAEKPAPSGSVFSAQAPWWAYALAIVVVGGLIYFGTNRDRSQSEQASQRTAAIAQGKKISTALVSFEKRFNHYPPAYTADARRLPLLSWRVHLLPFLGYQELYEKFNLEETWDSPHNAQLLGQMPAEYQNVGLTLQPGHTCWQAVSGPRTVLVRRELVPPSARKPGVTMSLILDGTPSTVAIVEVDSAAAVPWTSPADYELDAEQPWQGLGEHRPGKVLIAGFADGAARAIPKTVSAELLLRLFLRDDRESVEEFFNSP